MMSEFRINVYPPYRGNSPTGMSGMGEGRYTSGAFVKLTEEERVPPDDDQRSKFIDQLLTKYRLGGSESETDPVRVKEVAA